MLKRIDNNYGIKNDLMEQAKEKNAEIRENNKKLAMEAIKGNKELEDTYKELKGKEKLTL